MTTPQHANRSLSEWLILGKSALLSHRGEKAEHAFATILRSDPEHPEALQGLMTAWLLLGKSDQVIEYVDESPTTLQEQLREYLWISLAMQVGHMTAEGYGEWLCLPIHLSERLKGLRELADKFNKCGALAIDWAKATLDAFELDEAERALKQIREAEPPIPEQEIARLYACRDALQLKEHPEINTLLYEAGSLSHPGERFARLEPIANTALHISALQRETGLALLEMKKYDAALRYLHRAVDMNPYWANALVELGIAAMHAQRTARAQAAFQRAFRLSRNPKLETIHLSLQTQLEKAPHLEKYEAALDRISVGDFAGAIEPLQQAIQLAPNVPFLRWELGQTYLALHQYAKASSTLRGAWGDALEAQKPLNAEQLSLLELAVHQHILELVSEQQLEDAAELLDDMLSMDQSFALLTEDQQLVHSLRLGRLHPKAFFAYIHAQRKITTQPKQALQLLKQAISLAPNFGEALLTRSILLAETGQLADAEQNLQMAMPHIDSQAMSLFHMAGLVFLQQDHNTAIQLWNQCIDCHEEPWATRSRANLKALRQKGPSSLFLAWLPTHIRVVQFTPATNPQMAGVPATSQPPSPSRPQTPPPSTNEPPIPLLEVDLETVQATEEEPFFLPEESPKPAPVPGGDLFDISPSIELDVEVPSQNAIKALATELPKFSDLAPSDTTLPTPEDPLAFLSNDQLDAIGTDEDELFGIPKDEPIPSFLDAEMQVEAISQPPVPAPVLPPENTEADPLFGITDRDELKAEFPLDIAREKAQEDVPTLSQVAPGTTELFDPFAATRPTSPASIQQGGSSPIAHTEEYKAPDDLLSLLPSEFDDNQEESNDALPPTPFFAPTDASLTTKEKTDALPPPPTFFTPPPPSQPQAEADAPVPLLPVEATPAPAPSKPKSVMGSLFGDEDDLSSFLDEAFLSLDNIEDKEK